MPCLILFHDRPGSFQLIPLRRVELLKYPHYKRFSGDLEVSSKISVSWEKSNFNMKSAMYFYEMVQKGTCAIYIPVYSYMLNIHVYV